jgi:hypothetical protein
MLKQACLGLFLLAATPLLQAFELSPYTATYRFNLDNKLKGSATRTLEAHGSGLWRYSFSASAASVASASESSDFRFDGQTVTPLGYQQQRNIFFKKKKAAIAFDWKARKGHGTRDDKPPADYALGAGVLDSLNMEIQLRRDLVDLGKLGGPYSLATPKDLSPLEFVIDGKEVLNTAMGKLNTLRVSRKHHDPSRHTTFWLAIDHKYLPAKVTQNDNGTVYSLEITGVRYTAAAK